MKRILSRHRNWLLAGLAWASLSPAIAGAQDCYGSRPPQSQPTCNYCRHHCRHNCCCNIPEGVVLPSAPALFFGASTLSVLPAGINAQAFGTNRSLTDNDLQQLLRLLQPQQQGFSPPSCSGTPGVAAPIPSGAPAPPAAPGVMGAFGTPAPLSLEARLLKAERDVRELRAHVDQHADTLARIIHTDTKLQKLFEADPNNLNQPK